MRRHSKLCTTIPFPQARNQFDQNLLNLRSLLATSRHCTRWLVFPRASQNQCLQQTTRGLRTFPAINSCWIQHWNMHSCCQKCVGQSNAIRPHAFCEVGHWNHPTPAKDHDEKVNSSTLQLLEKTFAFHQMVCHYVARIGCKLPFSHQELEVSRRLGDKIQHKNWQHSAGNVEQQWNQLLRPIVGGSATRGRHHPGISFDFLQPAPKTRRPIRRSSAPRCTQIQGAHIPRTSPFQEVQARGPRHRNRGPVEPGSNNFPPPPGPDKSQSSSQHPSQSCWGFPANVWNTFSGKQV